MTKKLPYKDDMDSWYALWGNLRACFISQVVPKTGKLLDIAGYHGALKEYISKDIEYHLLDLFAPEKENCTRFDLNYLNIHKLPYDDKSFDIVVAVDIFEHIKRPFELLEEIGRILKDDGKLITSRHINFTKRHYFQPTEIFFEEWIIVGKILATVASMIYEGKPFNVMVQTEIPSEIFYMLKKDLNG